MGIVLSSDISLITHTVLCKHYHGMYKYRVVKSQVKTWQASMMLPFSYTACSYVHKKYLCNMLNTQT